MKLDIMPTECSGLSCSDGLVISVVEWLKRDYSLLFAEAWNFQFSSESEEHPHTIDDRLYINNAISKELLRSNCGIELSYYKNVALENFLDILKTELSQQRPMIIRHDLFWCPWSKEYFQKTHARTHTSLVIGIDEQGIICIDYSPRCEGATLPFEYLSESVQGFITFDIKPLPLNVNIDWQDIIQKSISTISCNNTFNTIRKFGSFIRSSFDPVKELQSYGIDNFDSNPLNWQIQRISESRAFFARTLRTLSKKCNIENFLMLAEKLESTKARWSNIMTLIIKSCISSDFSILEKISTRIDELADFEEAIFKCLVAVSNDPHSELILPSILDPFKNKQRVLPSDICYLDLSEYCNNRAFDTGKDCTYIPDFTGDGAFILKDEDIPRKMMSSGDMIFKLADLSNGLYDNISCQGQTIELPKKKYKSIFLLGCSTNGNYSEDFKINYLDGDFQTVKLEFSDCYPPSAAFDQQIIWIGSCSRNYISKTVEFRCQFYAQSYELNYLTGASTLVLPNRPQMHIFAISLVQ